MQGGFNIREIIKSIVILCIIGIVFTTSLYAFITNKHKEEMTVYYKASLLELSDTRENLYSAAAQNKEIMEEVMAPKMTYLGNYFVTGYDNCIECCGKTNGITASNVLATVGHTIAADPSFPFDTRIYIEGIGERVVEDRGDSVRGKIIDVYCNNHKECSDITGYYDIYLIEE